MVRGRRSGHRDVVYKVRTVNGDVVSRKVVRVSDRDSMLMARIATAREGILMGESGGTVLWAALQMARDLAFSDVVYGFGAGIFGFVAPAGLPPA